MSPPEPVAADPAPAPPRQGQLVGPRGLFWAVFAGAAVTVALAVYGAAHTPAGRPLFTLGFSGPLQMKAWLSTIVMVLVVAQLVTALWMWGRLPGVGAGGPAVAFAHRWTGTAAFVVSLPVAFQCLWTLGFSAVDARVAIHSLAGCAFYGAYTAKMLGLRVKGLPSWALPVLGGLVFALLVVLWLTAALWLFTRPGVPSV
jgi:hypothetical protein